MIIIVILLICFLFCRCFVIKKVFTKSNKSNKLIDFEKTICFGTCPIYKATIYADGSVDYYGEKYVKNIGYKHFKLSQFDINEIIDKINQINFMNLNDVYDASVTDVPTTYITLYKNNMIVKKVKARFGYPDDLDKLIDLIHSKLNN